MILESIKIRNFHCYKEVSFDFSRETTVLIGKNGSGKSSLIKAIRNGLSVFFSNNSWGYRSLASAVSDLKVTNLNVREVWHDDKNVPAEFAEIRLIANLYNGQPVEWSFYKQAREKANLQTSYYKDAYIKFMESLAHDGILPLFAYYSDRFPHIDAKLSSTIRNMLDNDDVFDRSWGYYHWDFDTSCAEIWQKRFIRIFRLHSYYTQQLWEPDADLAKIQPKVERYKAELEHVRKYLRIFSGNEDALLSNTSENLCVKDLFVDGVADPYIVVSFADGSRKRWDELPAGYERLFNIVFDIAYRSYMLNGPEQDVKGIVFIDELDLHLHPSMEQDVLRRLRNTFPKVQLIISTHSPLVVSNFMQNENNSIVQMEYVDGNYSHYKVENTFGMDYDMTLSSIMHTEPRVVFLQMLWDKYRRLILREKIEKAQETLLELKKYLPEESVQKKKKAIEDSLSQEHALKA